MLLRAAWHPGILAFEMPSTYCAVWDEIQDWEPQLYSVFGVLYLKTYFVYYFLYYLNFLAFI
jgi:hypothetical protein